MLIIHYNTKEKQLLKKIDEDIMKEKDNIDRLIDKNIFLLNISNEVKKFYKYFFDQKFFSNLYLK